MPQVTVTLTFNSVDELSAYFTCGLPNSAATPQQPAFFPQPLPQPQTQTPPPIFPQLMPQGAAQVQIANAAPAPAATQATVTDPRSSPAYLAMSAMMKRFPTGTGAVKSREILAKYGVTKTSEIKPEHVALAIADFNAAQP